MEVHQRSNFMVDILLQTIINNKDYAVARKKAFLALQNYPGMEWKLIGILKISLRFIKIRKLIQFFKRSRSF